MSRRVVLGRFIGWHELGLAALLAGVLIVAGALEPGFVAWPTQRDLSAHVWELALLAVPMTLIIITAGVDLSVGSAMGLCAVVLGLWFEGGGSPWAGAGLALLTGAAAGLLNGLFVARVRVHPLIVTLATFAAFRGIAEGISLGRPISGFPDAFCNALSMPAPAIAFAVAAAAAGGLLAATTVGRAVYAVGHNEPAARWSGLRVDRLKMCLYALSGLAAGAAGVLYVARRNTANAEVGAGRELEVITAVVLGGSSIFGGRGRVVGSLLGVLLIHEVREFVSWRWDNEELIHVVVGGLLIGAVLFHSMLARRSFSRIRDRLRFRNRRGDRP